ncbi:Hypothetical protein D9617_18g034330 [Elsinoe fawcettii]|nr:Hypothetical protein D9617_18g034330 [Elsinoe fawcettii]
MAIASQLSLSNTDKTFPARIRGLQRLGQQGIRRAMTFARSDTEITTTNHNFLGVDLNPATRPLSRASVLSLASLSAWNRTSMLSTTDIQDNQVHYRLHYPSTTASSRSSISSHRSSISGIDACITDIDGAPPDAAAFEVASNTHGFIPPMKRFAIPSSQPLPSESWSSFMDRVLQPEACRPTTLRRLSSSEFNSPVTPGPEHDEVLFDGPSKCSEEDWLDLEETIIREAQVAKQASVKVVKKGEVKLVDISKPKIDQSLSSPAYQRRSFSTADLAITTSIMDVLGKIVTKSKSADSIKHDSLPYQPYSGRFDPFNESPASDNDSPTESLSKADCRKCSIVQSNSNIELHLPPPSDVVAPTAPTGPVSSTADINRISWFDATESVPLSFNATAVDKDAGLLTRKLTNASPATPDRVVMNSAFPIFPRKPAKINTDDTRRHSCPIICKPIATPASEVIINPKPEVPASHYTNRPALKRPYSADLSTGILSRADTVAAERQSKVLRTAMNQSYPIFLRRDSQDIHLGTAQTAIRVQPRLVRGKLVQNKRHNLPAITEVATPPSTSAGESLSGVRKDSFVEGTEVKDFASDVPEIKVTAPSLAASNSVHSARSTGSTPASDLTVLETTTATASIPAEERNTIDVLLYATVAAPVEEDTARVSIGDVIAAAAPIVPTGPSHNAPRQSKKLVKRRPAPPLPKSVRIASSTDSVPAAASDSDVGGEADKGTAEGKQHHHLSFASRMHRRSAKLGSGKIRAAVSESAREMSLRKSKPSALGSHEVGKRDYVGEDVPQ